MHKLISPFIAILILLIAPPFALGKEKGTRAEAIAMVKKVKSMYRINGALETFKAVTGKKFNDRDLYPFINDLRGEVAAHGVKNVLVGKNLLELHDGEGVPLIKLMIQILKTKENGWVDYKWPNPVTGQLTPKSAYVERLGNDYFVGVGVHK